MPAHDSMLNDSLQLPPGLGLATLREGMEAFFHITATQPVSEKRTFYDTFQWTLWFNQQALYHDGSKTVLSILSKDWIDAPLAIEHSETGPGPFPSTWPDGPLRRRLARAVGLRALMPIAEIHSSTCTVDFMNADQKVVFRLDLISLFETSNQHTPYLRICHPHPLRGYHQEAAAALTQLKALGCTAIEKGPIEQNLISSGRAPAPYTLRPVYGLGPAEPCREAVRDIVRSMLSLARLQEQGIINEIDTEFLHDYRICIRKIRSAVGLMKGVYPESYTVWLKQQWGELARVTNQMRDLEVYLLDRENYVALLPSNLQAGLTAFFEGIRRERGQAQQDLRKHLQSKSYLKRIAALESFFTEPDVLPASEFSAQPIKVRASRRIYGRYRCIRKASRGITPDTPDDVIHQIRLDCKKLRYMLEFFGELYDHDELDVLMKKLKNAQECLGVFNDCVVQQDSLLAYCRTHQETMSAEQALSIGGLIAVLNLRQREERSKAERALKIFSKASVQRQFRHAFQLHANDAT